MNRCIEFHVTRTVLCAVLSLATVGAAGAQSAGTAGPISLGPVFVPELADFVPGADVGLIQAARAATPSPGQCPAKFTAVVPQGDELFQPALALARLDKIQTLLANAGLCASGCEFHWGFGSADDLKIEAPPPDHEPPVLQIDWPPLHGYRAGEDIVVTVTARDDANTWQSGIGSLQLYRESADGGMGERVDGSVFSPRQNCDGLPEPREMRATYTVSHGLESPPRSFRLVVTASDFATNNATESHEFFLADLSGIWLDQAAGQEVRVTHSGTGVSATYLQPRSCEHDNGTNTSSDTTFDFAGQLQDNQIDGELGVCKWGTPDAGWKQVQVELIVAENFREIHGRWNNSITGEPVAIAFTWLRDQ